MGKGSQTSSTSPNPIASADYQSLLGQAQGVAQTPYQAYTGQLVAPVNSQQTTGINNINANAGFASPYVSQAAGLATGAANPLTASQIQNYESPYTQSVVNATQAQFNNQNQQQQAQLTGNNIAQGALGGNRTGVAAANLANQQQLAQAPVIAGLENQGYTQALQTAAQQYQQNPLNAASSIANFGISGQNAALQGANAQVGAGTLQQQTQQAQDTANYGQYAQQQAYPFQTTQWLAGLEGAIAPGLGSSTTGPAPNTTAQYLGAGVAGAGLLLSDRRAKQNVHKIGSTNDGQPLYRYQYKGSDQWHIGPIAQEVEKHHPEAVHAGLGGLKYVDLKAATDDSVSHKAHGGPVAGLAVGGTPWSFADGWVPTFQGAGSTAPRSVSSPSTQSPNINWAGLGNTKLNSSGLLSSNPTYGGGNMFTDANGGSSANPLEGLDASDYGAGFARGGVAGYADGGSADNESSVVRGPWGAQDNQQQPIHPIKVFRIWDEAFPNGVTTDAKSPERGLGGALYRERGGVAGYAKGYADGGSPDDMDNAPWPVGPIGAPTDADPFGEANRTAGLAMLHDQMGTVNPTEPYRMPDQAAVDQWRAGTPNTPVVAADDSSDDEAPAAPVAGLGSPSPLAAPAASPRGSNAGVAGFASPTLADAGLAAPSTSGDGINKNFWPAVMATGLGMMASKSPFFGVALGEGGLQGLNAFSQAQAADQKAQQDNRRIEMEAQRLQMAAQQAMREAVAAPITADGKINPTYLDLKKREADINQKDNFAVIGNVLTADGSLHPLAMNKADHTTIDLVTQKPPLASDRVQSLPGKGPDPSVIQHNVEGIASGRQPPTLTGLYGMSGAVRAGLEEKGFDLAHAQMEWDRAKKQIATLNGPQMTRFVGLAHSVDSTIDEVRELSKQMKLSGIPALNSLELAGYIKTQGNSENGQLATRYMTAVNTLKEEFANLANGGYAPTEPAWKLADQQINGTYGVNQLGASLDEVQRLIRYRVNAIPGLNQNGPGAANRYTGQAGQQPAQSSPATAAQVVPQRPTNVPAGSAYSPSRNQWRAPDGAIYNADGSRS